MSAQSDLPNDGVTLCENCFPPQNHEILTICPWGLVCEQCRHRDGSQHGGLQVHRFRSDPRPISS